MRWGGKMHKYCAIPPRANSVDWVHFAGSREAKRGVKSKISAVGSSNSSMQPFPVRPDVDCRYDAHVVPIHTSNLNATEPRADHAEALQAVGRCSRGQIGEWK